MASAPVKLGAHRIAHCLAYHRHRLLDAFPRSDGSSHYFFLISSDGYYGLGIFTDGEAALLGQPAMEVSPAIARGAAPNHLRMDCAGSQLAGYVNEVKVAQTEDARLKNGEVGILAGDFEEPGADIVFDNFVVLQP